VTATSYRDFWTVPVDDVPAKTGAAGVMDCADIRDVLAHLDLDLSGKNVLDVGCGTGRLAQLCGEYIGFDVSESMVAYAQTHGVDAYVLKDPGNLVGSYDIATCLSVFTHISGADRYRYLEEFRFLASELLVDILPGKDGGSIAAWYTDPAEFELDLHDTGFDTIVDTYQRVSADGHTHLYYHCR
jgi:SAM-dependent methyltransferase